MQSNNVSPLSINAYKALARAWIQPILFSGHEILLRHHWQSKAALGNLIVFVVAGFGEDTTHSMLHVNSQTTSTYTPGFHPELCAWELIAT